MVLFLASHKELTKDGENGSSNDEEDVEDEDDMYSPVDNEAKSMSSSNQYQRRRSRAVLYQLSGHYRKSVTMKSKLKLNNVSKKNALAL